MIGRGSMQPGLFEDHLGDRFINSNNQLKSHKNSNSNQSQDGQGGGEGSGKQHLDSK